MNKKYTLAIDSDLSNLTKIEHFVEAISDEFNIGNTYFPNIIVSITELVKNSIIHGNKNDTTKKVFITCEQNEGKLLFSIVDEGIGFVNGAPSLNLDSKTEKEGNGLYLVKFLSDGLEFNNNGSEINVCFNISSANELLSKKRIDILKQENLQENKNCFTKNSKTNKKSLKNE